MWIHGTLKVLFFFQLEKLQKSIDCLTKALEINPNNINAIYYKGIVLEELENHEEAMKCFNKALEINPDYEEVKQAIKFFSNPRI